MFSKVTVSGYLITKSLISENKSSIQKSKKIPEANGSFHEAISAGNLNYIYCHILLISNSINF